MRRSDFHFDLPKELIAQEPPEERSASRLLTLDRRSGALQDRQFRDFPQLLNPGDLVVFNDTRVVPARVHGVKDSGGKIEILLERVLAPRIALVHARASKGLKVDARVDLPGAQWARMLGREGDLFRLEFSCGVLDYFDAHGTIPLPPYIERAASAADRERYQTVFARAPGAVAAPTAGLHFDATILSTLRSRGIALAFVTLHVGAGTFQPMRADDIDEHIMHSEHIDVSAATCAAIEDARRRGGRVIAVGTTVVRSLESAAAGKAAAGDPAAGDPAAGDPAVPADESAARSPVINPYRGATRIFIKPGYRFTVVDAMLTNFHLPESTLLMLCSAFAGREAMLRAYAHAVRERYRFFSYGDAMFLS